MQSIMKETTLYLEAVESLRKEKGLSIEALIEDVTSERSYRRYIQQELPIPLHVLEKLILKLDVDLPDILIYVLKVKNKPSGIIEFFTYVHYQELELSKPFYLNLKNYDKDTPLLNTLVMLYMNYYDYQRSDLNLEQLHAIFDSHRVIFDITMPTIESLSYFILCAYLFDDLTYHDVIVSSLLEKNFYMSQILLFDIIIDQYLIVLSRLNQHLDDYLKLSALFFQLSHAWHDSYFIYSAHIHQAYLKYLTQDHTTILDIKKHLYYEYILLSKPSQLYTHILSTLTSKPRIDIIKQDLLEALSD